MSQTFRTLIHSRLQVGFSAYDERYPGKEFLLFEPDRAEYRMFFSNVFSLGSRRAVCELAYRATRSDLLRRADVIGPALARRGVRLRPDVLREARAVWDDEPARFTAEFRALPAAVSGRSETAVPDGGSVTERLTGLLDRLEAETAGS